MQDYFIKIVERDLRNTASANDRSYLESSIDQWNDSLQLLYMRAIDHLGILKLRTLEEKQIYLTQGPKAKSAWFARKLELDRKRNATRRFAEHVRQKRLEVKQLKREAEKQALVQSTTIADYFPSAAGELLSLLTYSKQQKIDIDLFLTAFAIRIVQLYDQFAPCEEEILDRITAVEPEGIMDMWEPEEE
jgi:hypothetical protein